MKLLQKVLEMSSADATLLTGVGEGCSKFVADLDSSILDIETTLRDSFRMAKTTVFAKKSEMPALIVEIKGQLAKVQNGSVDVLTTTGGTARPQVFDAFHSAELSLKTTACYAQSRSSGNLDEATETIRNFAQESLRFFLRACKNQDAASYLLVEALLGEYFQATPAERLKLIEKIYELPTTTQVKAINPKAEPIEFTHPISGFQLSSFDVDLGLESERVKTKNVPRQETTSQRTFSHSAIASFLNSIAKAWPLILFLSVLSGTIATVFDNSGVVFASASAIAIIIFTLVFGCLGLVAGSDKPRVLRGVDLTSLLPRLGRE
ncbi:MAG: hypothetical protein ABL888_14705 [Pirellulaceae bacterium]